MSKIYSHLTQNFHLTLHNAIKGTFSPLWNLFSCCTSI